MSRTQALKEEIQSSLGSGPNPRGTSILRSVTDLFVNRANDYSDEQVEVFDDVMQCLLDYTEHDARIELSGRLATAPRAPAKVVRTLVKDKDPAVSSPILSQSAFVSDGDLTELAQNGSLEQAMTIAKRPYINRLVSEALIGRKNAAIAYAVLANENAELSETSFVMLIGECTNDAQLGNLLAARKDLPPELRPFLDAYKQENKAQEARRKPRR
jgi:uncharacterized protein (DUF2336 family)